MESDQEQYLMATSDLNLHACTHTGTCVYMDTTGMHVCTYSHGYVHTHTEYNLTVITFLYYQHFVYGIIKPCLSLTCHNLCKRKE